MSDPALAQSYSLALNLQTEKSRTALSDVKTPEQIYVVSLTDALELLLTEDEIKFEKYEDNYETSLELLEKVNPQTAGSLFATAELRLQWAFVYLKFGHELDAAWNVRQAYLTVQECKKRFPDFVPIKKTSGLLEIMMGSVPEKYQWIISLLNMEGSVETGLKELEEVRDQCESLKLETTLLYYLFQSFTLQHTEVAMQGLDETIKSHPDNQLALFLGASVAIKNSQSEKALVYLKKINDGLGGLSIRYAHYQLGEVYLHKGEYKSSIQSYQKFLNGYKGQNYIKDAHYKIGICYWLMGNANDAKKYFEKAKALGKESAEADKYAARQLLKYYNPNVKLSKLRYATDGGYYDNAQKVISSVADQDLVSNEEKIEFTYRKARLFHKMGSPKEAEKNYLETITKQGEENWYFAPNACLQLGYLFLEQEQSAEAKKYFEKALTYKKHEYKNSIDSKAKSALAQLKKK